MPPTLEWYKKQSDYNRRFYEWLHKVRPRDMHDWKVNALLYSGLHRAKYQLVKQTRRAPETHAERNRRVRHELPRVFDDYRDLYMASIRARYCDGFRVTDDRRESANERLCRIEKKVLF